MSNFAYSSSTSLYSIDVDKVDFITLSIELELNVRFVYKKDEDVIAIMGGIISLTVFRRNSISVCVFVFPILYYTSM